MGRIIPGREQARLGKFFALRSEVGGEVGARGTEFGPLRDRHGAAAVVIAAGGRSLDVVVIIVDVVGLAHAAGVRRGRRDRQCQRGKDTHERQRQQDSGGQLTHELRNSPTSNKTIADRIC